MAQITITEIIKCDGGAHWKFTGTVNGVPRSHLMNPLKVKAEWEEKSLQDRFEARIYAESIEKDLTTFAQVRNNFLNKTVEI